MPAYSTHSFDSEFYDVFHHDDRAYQYSITTEDAKKKPQVKYLWRYLNDMGCQSILVEKEYVDHDFLDDFTCYYATCFTEYKRLCRRLHFFSVDVTKLPIEEIFTNKHHECRERLDKGYLGFCVVKPLPNTVIGRTVLKTYDSESVPRHYRAVRSYAVNLFGLPLRINSLAFQEQDRVLAACATTALWSAFQMTCSLFNTSLPTPSEITRAATKYVQTSRPVPSHGLIVEQMCYAISENRLTPEVYHVNADTPVNSLIHSYVSSGIPVILGYQIEGTSLRHAVTVCGYRLESHTIATNESRSLPVDMPLIGRMISEFYVHDDNLGPFSRLRCQTNASPTVNPRVFKRESGSTPNDYSCLPDLVIVPLYHKIRLTFNDLLGATRKIDRYFKALEIEAFQDNNPDRVHWEIRLVRLDIFKKKLLKSEGIDIDQKKKLLFSNLPKYLWVSSASIHGARQFSLVADASDIQHSFYFEHFLCHSARVKQSLSELIRSGDCDMSKAKAGGLPADFVRLVERDLLS